MQGILIKVNAREIKLKKIGGNNTLIYQNANDVPTNLSSVPDYITPTFLSTNEMIFTEITLDANRNWTEMCNAISMAINLDPENDLSNVEYEIKIDHTNSNNYPYIVGRQIRNGLNPYDGNNLYFAVPVHIFSFVGTQNNFINKVTITSFGNSLEHKANFKYTDNLYFGSWLNPGQVATLTINPTTTHTNSSTTIEELPFPKISGIDRKIRADIGIFIWLNFANNVSISNIDVDGSIANAKIGGYWGDKHWQCLHTGLSISNSKNINIANCDMKQFGLDGISVAGILIDNINISDCIFDGNGRLGMAWVGGKNVTASNCQFLNTGKTFYSLKNIYVSSDPAAGLDIENEMACNGGVLIDGKWVYDKPCLGSYDCPVVETGKFNDCIFSNNTNTEVLNESFCEIQDNRTNDMIFTNCIFSDEDGVGGIWTKGNQFKYINCTIAAPVVYVNRGSSDLNRTEFIGCKFRDITHDGIPWIDNNDLVYLQFEKRVLFQDSEFEVSHSKSNFISYKCDGISPAEFGIIDNCRFNYNYEALANDGSNNSHLINILFRGKTKFYHQLNIPTSSDLVYVTNCMLEGSDDPCEPNEIEIVGQTQFNVEIGGELGEYHHEFSLGRKLNGSKDGYAKFISSNKSNFALNPNSDVEINKNSTIIIDDNGSMVCRPSINGHPNFVNMQLSGNLIAKASSFIQMPNVFISYDNISGLNPLFYIDNTCNLNNVTLSPTWGGNSTNSVSNWLGNFGTPIATGQLVPCIQGGHSSLPSSTTSFICPVNTIYNKIYTNGPFCILYNLEEIGNTNVFNFTFQPQGGLPNYICTLDGAPAIIGNVYPLNGGVHALIITDANGCSTDYFFNTDGSLAIGCAERIPVGKNPNPISNLTSSNLITFYGISVIANKNYYINGNFVVDQNIEFNNCNFYFTSGSSISLLGNNTLSMNNCNLSSACNGMWNGITANSPNQQIVLNNCILSDMENGVISDLGAKVNSTGTTYIDNYISLQFKGTPVGYANNAIITGNTFTSSGSSLLPPYNNLTKGNIGIQVTECRELQIGEQVNGSHNTFNNLNTGILFNPQVFIYTGDLYLLNNNFTNINDNSIPDPEDKINQMYVSQIGVGVFMNYQTQKIHIESINHDAKFENCDKAVVGRSSSLDLHGYEIKNCLVGIGVNDANGKEYYIAKNKITNTMLGIQLRGDVNKASIEDHYGVDGGITVLGGSLSGNFAPIGIDVGFYSSTHPGEVEIVNNQVNLLGNVGLGINALQAGFNTRIWNNKIYFNAAVVGGQTGLITNDLTGIRSVFGLDNKIDANLVFGIHANARGSVGIELIQNRNIAMACNQVNNSQLGIAAVGNCGTPNDKVVGNIMNNHVYGLMTMPYVLSQGNLNDIGILNTQDNFNLFLGSYLNSGNEKTYRWWSNNSVVPTIPNRIFTSLSFNNGSNYSNGNFVNVNTPNPYICDDGIGYDNGGGPIFGVANLEEAEDIMEGNMIFESYPDICQWVAEQNLYIDLDRDSITRNSSTEFVDFYSDHYSVAMGELFRVEQLINELNANFNSATLSTQIQLISTLNDAIVTTEQHEIYLKEMNSTLLKVMVGDRDNLTVMEKNKIHDLAHSCPAQNGLAVFKARQLNTLYEPLVTYNDYALCAPANKGGKGLYDDLISFLNGIEDMETIDLENKLVQQQVTLYPVPSSEVINIKFTIPSNKEAVLYIYDCTGKMLMQKTINEGRLNTIEVSSLINGLYTYRISNDLENYTGRFNIIK